MAYSNPSYSKNLYHLVFLMVFVTTRSQLVLGATGQIGVCYGLNGDNLPSPQQVVALLKSKGIAQVRLYEAKQEITQAFANSGIELLLGIPNDLVPKLALNLAEAVNWVTQNVVPFPNSDISAIIVGNEWLLDSSHDPSLLLPAMLNVHAALTTAQLLSLDLGGIKVSTSHALNVLGISFPPSAAQFDRGLLSLLSPILQFLEQTGSFFMVNIFPYFAYVNDPNVAMEFALFEAKEAVRDPKTGLNYTNLFDLQLDAVYAALDGYTLLGGMAAATDDELEEEENGMTGTARAASTLYKRRRNDKSTTHIIIGRRSSMSRMYKRRQRVLVGESGWPSGSGGSGSVPHAQPLIGADRRPLRAEKVGERHGIVPRRQQQTARDVVQAAPYYEGSHEHRRVTNLSSNSADVSVEKAVTCGFSVRVCGAATVENARRYNQNLIRHVLQAGGTPANPTTPIHAFVFSVFNEDLKPAGPEQHYGLFFPNGAPVYPITFH